MRLRRLAKRWRIQGVSMFALFSIVTLSFSIFFSTLTEGVKVKSPERQVATVSTKGKTGATSPLSTLPKAANSGKSGISIGKKLGAATLTIPPKPAWTSMSLYVDPTNTASQYAAANPSAAGADYISRMGQQPVAEWFGDWNGNVQADVSRYVSAAAANGKVPVVVVYNIPNRDCGGYSIGGAAGVSQYTQWVQQVAAGIGNQTAVVIVEPDALGALDCLPAAVQKDRTSAISQAVTILKTKPNASVYIDAGTPYWQSTATMSKRLQSANVSAADGFSLNISYFASTSANRSYGDTLSSLIGYKHYVIDTSRNGANHAVSGMQCNPSWAALGSAPTTNTGSALNDALLWIKIPWESDGECNGSPGPGEPYWSYAVQLAQNAGW